MHTLRILLVGAIAVSWCCGAGAATYVPFPDWWEWNPSAPADNQTREQYHSFLADPNLGLSPDWTYNGFTPSVADSWTLTGVGPYNVFAPDGLGWGFYTDPPGPDGTTSWLNDNYGALVAEDATLIKLMGNEARTDWTKEFYFVVIGFTNDPQLNVDTDLITPSGESVEVTYENWFTDPSAPGWFAAVVGGTIIPQPDWEQFWLQVTHDPSTVLWIDSVYVGTICEAVPEPGTAGMLLVVLFCWLGYARRRRT